ncbi:DUF368 domain-containing protein [Planctomicrobium sp. SH664]|uniref:DUF368 domain-containing protein n=1 Tax=Planctomicrobium sp. SH664 TaxID=3448125 RepID=UPI003F5B5016
MPETTTQQPAPGSAANFGVVATFCSGVAMGTCNVIPGGDSGTIALIIGIYERIVTAISHVDGTLFAMIVQRRWREAIDRLDLKFMVPLMVGVGTGIATVGSLMHYLLEHHYHTMLPIFFGMIAASCYLVARLVPRWRIQEILLLVFGFALAMWLVLQPALQHPPQALWYIFLCGLIGICALILPGISGAFILLVMGRYHDLTGVIHRATKLSLDFNDFLILVAFGLGCLFGVVGCSKFLKWLLARYEYPTLAFLCGIKVGSLWKIWPIQVDTTPQIAEFKDKLFEPLPLNQTQLNSQFWITMGIVVISAVAVLALEYFSVRRNPVAATVHEDLT